MLKGTVIIMFCNNLLLLLLLSNSWLQKLNLLQYKPAMENSGICHLSQVISLDQDVSAKCYYFIINLFNITATGADWSA